MSTEDAPLVVDNAKEQRFEITVDGHRAELVYQRLGDRLVLVHTEVPGALEGRGLGGTLVRAALDAAVADSLVVVPECPFAQSWLRKHPDAAGRVTIDWPDG
jgi:predicted GNAT family acetyltransferase